MSNKLIVIVAGAHRSGTSLTSMLLHSSGINMGREFIPPLPSNPKGHYENKWFVEIHEKIIREAGGMWFDLPSQDLLEESFYKNIPLIKNVIKRSEDIQWGWKDPRNSFFMYFYFKYNLIDRKNSKIIVCWRNPYSIALSMQKRDKFPLNKCFCIIFDLYNRLYENLIKLKEYGIPVLHLKFEDYFVKPKEQIKKLSEFLRIDIKNWESIIDKKLEHF